MNPWKPVAQGLQLLRFGTLLTMVGMGIILLLTGSLLGYWLGQAASWMVFIGGCVALTGQFRAAQSGPANMGGRKLLAIGVGAELLNVLLLKLGPSPYYNTFLSKMTYNLEWALGVTAFAALMFGLTSLSAHIKRDDLFMGFLGLFGTAVAGTIALRVAGWLDLRFVFEHLWAVLFCLGGYWYIFTAMVKSLAKSVEEYGAARNK